MKSAAALLCLCVVAVTAEATTPAAPNNGVQSMLEQGQSITRERKSLEAQQAKLMKQKADLDAAAQTLNQQQAALNQDIEANNQAITQQGSKTGQNQADCQPGKGGAGQTNQCNQDIKALNVSRADLKAQQDALKQRQADLDAAFQHHAQDAQAWNDAEQKVVTRLNAVYQGQNNWMDAANSLIGSEGFQTLASQANAGARCTGTVPKGDRVTPALLQKYTDLIVGCLAYVAKHSADAPAG